MTSPLDQRDSLDRKLLWAGVLLQFAYLLFAVLYFKERTLYADSAHFIAEICGTNQFYLGHRLIAILTRFLPVLGANLGASIQANLVLYSVNLALMYSVPILLIGYVFKDKRMFVGLLLFQFLFPLRTHYLAISELQHGLILLFLFWAFVSYHIRKNKSILKSVWTYVFLIFIFNAHPLILIPYFASLFLIAHHEEYWNLSDQKIIIPIALIIYLVSILFFHSDYESIISKEAAASSQAGINFYQIRLMISTLIRQYYVLMIAGVLAASFLIFKKPKKVSIGIALLIIINLILVYLRFAYTTLTLTFFEIYLSPIAFILMIILSMYLTKSHAGSLFKGLFLIITVLFVIQSFSVIKHASFYSDRLKIYEEVFDQMETESSSKVILPFYKAPMNKIVDFYATPFESYLLSQIDKNPLNNGFIISYLLDEEVDISSFENHSREFITLGINNLDFWPFDHYDNFSFINDPYQTFEVKY